MSAVNDPENVRAALAETLGHWLGPILVIDGSLSDELERSRYADLGRELDRHATERLLDDDDTGNFPETSLQWLETRLDRAIPVTLAGAWFDSSWGCVVAIAEGLRQRGFAVRYGKDLVMKACDATIPEETLPPITGSSPRKHPSPG
jgi:hypothetical protein